MKGLLSTIGIVGTAVAFLAAAAPAEAGHDAGNFLNRNGASDPFGYIMESDPAWYDWEDIKPTGTEVATPGSSANAVWGPIELPPGFTFRFYGSEVTQFWASARGTILFEDPASMADPSCCTPLNPPPRAPGGHSLVALGGDAWRTEDMGGSGNLYHGASPTDPDIYIIQVDDMDPYSASRSGSVTAQIKLFNQVSHIEVHVKRISDSNNINRYSAVVGMEGPDPSMGYAFFGMHDSSNGHSAPGLQLDMVRFVYPNQPPAASDDGDTDGDAVVDDAYHILDAETTDRVFDVLANDDDPDGDAISLLSVSATAHAWSQATLEGGQVRYTLDTDDPALRDLPYGASLTDVFTYEVADPSDLRDTATVRVRIDGVDLVPTLSLNAGITAQEDGAGVQPVIIDTTSLVVQDPDDDDGSVMFRLLEAPAGRLLLSGSDLATGATWSFADVQAGDISYMAPPDDPVGAPPHDTFAVRIYDPDSESDLAYLDGQPVTIEVHITPFDDPPSAAIGIGSGPFYAGVDVPIWDLSTAGDGAITGWLWDLGGGVTKEGRSVTHAFDAGNHEVTLYVTEGEHTIPATVQLEVLAYAPPVVDFRSDVWDAKVGERVTFTDTTVEGTLAIRSRSWDFDDVATSADDFSSPVTVHAFSRPGQFLVSLMVIDGTGRAFHAQHNVNVTAQTPQPESSNSHAPPPPPTADAGKDMTVLQGTVVRLSGTAPVGLKEPMYAWRQVHGPAVGLVGADSATPMFAVPWMDSPEVELVFRLDVWDEELRAQHDLVRVTVHKHGEADMSVAAVPSGFVVREKGSGSFVFEAPESDLPGVSYGWSLGDGSSATGRVVEHTYNASGWFNVRLWVTDAFGREVHTAEAVQAFPAPSEVQAPAAHEGEGMRTELLMVAIFGGLAFVAFGLFIFRLSRR